ncbi:hypothetical protein AD932_03320 [Gluconobacter oxydans]|nr:hypothetical protein AD932_03320 [Gluconobacter oxydans]
MADCDNWEKQAHYYVSRGMSCEYHIFQASYLIDEIKELTGRTPCVEQARRNFLSARRAVPLPTLPRPMSTRLGRSRKKLLI